ncbi:MAG: hypothetical protein HQL63_09395 [Magnetococcales bacterium]|nr:hypothetical protein [Magnetococcales bacterium]
MSVLSKSLMLLLLPVIFLLNGCHYHGRGYGYYHGDFQGRHHDYKKPGHHRHHYYYKRHYY